MEKKLNELLAQLSEHPVYKKLTTQENLQIFMSYHVFAVWDFMSLLKALQNKITCTQIPWNVSTYEPKLVRLVNEIVLAEESDIIDGRALSHFEMYLEAMDDVGANKGLIRDFITTLDLDSLPDELSQVVNFHLDIAQNGKDYEIASAFFYGRENIIPMLFTAITNNLKLNQLEFPKLFYYLDRHIELDGDEHGPMALECMSALLNTEDKKLESFKIAQRSLEQRQKLWDFILQKLN